MVLHMYCKTFDDNPPEQRCYGVIVSVDKHTKEGNVVAVNMAPTIDDLKQWFDMYLSDFNLNESIMMPYSSQNSKTDT